MPSILLLDAGPLGLVTNPKASPAATACNIWLEHVLGVGARVFIPEIADYEVRRELLRANKQRGLARLDELRNALLYLPISTEIMHRAAELWAQARQQGRPTADPSALDADVILAASALTMGPSWFLDAGEVTVRERQILIATTNVGHLSRFVDARRWEEIDPEEIRRNS